MKVNHEYVLLYKKSGACGLGYVIDPNTREDSNLWKGFAENSITKNGDANPPSEIKLPVGFPCVIENVNLPADVMPDEYYQDIEQIGYITRDITQKYNAVYPIHKDDVIVSDYKLVNSCRVFSGWANANKLKAFINNGCNPIIEGDDTIRFYLSANGVIYYYKERNRARNILSVLRNFGTTERMRSELESEGVIFKYPKPSQLLSYLIKVGGLQDDIILDFFAGSATSAHAVMQLNAEDGGKRKFIMVQLPEQCDKKSEAFKAGYKTIAEISKERIRRAGVKILAGECHKDWNKDVGFRVLKVDTSNMADVYYSPDQVSQGSLDLLVDNIKSDRTDEDLLFQVLLDWGVDLTLPIKKETIQGKTVFFVDDDALVACFDLRINEALIKELATKEPLRVVFRDDGFESDAVKINAEQIFKQVSPHTEVKAI